MMNRSVSLLLVGSMLATLNGCSLFSKDESGKSRDRDKEYLRSDTTSSISTPNGIDQPLFEPLYPIPDVRGVDEFGDEYQLLDYETPRPVPVNSDEDSLGVKIQSLAGERWVFLGASTSQVWPHAQSFLAGADVGVVNSNAELGLIETDWLQYKDDESVMARFRISLEKGIHPETTEVHVREYQVPMSTEVKMPSEWPEKSVDPAREEWMVREIAKHLAENISNASASLLGQNVGGEVKARYSKKVGEPSLRLNLSRARTWATLAHAARNQGFVEWDRSEPKGLIYAGYYEKQEEKRGFWRTVFTLGIDGKLPEKVDHSLDDVIKHLSGATHVREAFQDIPGVLFEDALKGVTPGYLILMSHNGEYAEIIIRDHRGRKLPADDAKRLIRILRNNLL